VRARRSPALPRLRRLLARPSLPAGASRPKPCNRLPNPNQVTRVEFGISVEGGPLLASSGGNSAMVWDFSGTGPAGSAPTLTLGHTKAVDCLVRRAARRGCWQVLGELAHT
jgi:hypothetical protein